MAHLRQFLPTFLEGPCLAVVTFLAVVEVAVFAAGFGGDFFAEEAFTPGAFFGAAAFVFEVLVFGAALGAGFGTAFGAAAFVFEVLAFGMALGVSFGAAAFVFEVLAFGTALGAGFGAGFSAGLFYSYVEVRARTR